eukprot:1156445-Pelagomonas_calceolata.AAC.3
MQNKGEAAVCMLSPPQNKLAGSAPATQTTLTPGNSCAALLLAQRQQRLSFTLACLTHAVTVNLIHCMQVLIRCSHLTAVSSS